MAAIEPRRRWGKRRLFGLGSLLLVVWLGLVASHIWRFGYRDFAEPADCIIVLGAAVHGEEPSPVFEERLRHGVHLHREGMARYLIFTGGKGEGQAVSEGEVGERYAHAQGIPQSALLKETFSLTTRSNLAEAQKVMNARGLRRAIVVSDPLHLKRASLMAKGMELQAFTSPTPTTRYQGWHTRLGFLLREVYFVHHYWVFKK